MKGKVMRKIILILGLFIFMVMAKPLVSQEQTINNETIRKFKNLINPQITTQFRLKFLDVFLTGCDSFNFICRCEIPGEDFREFTQRNMRVGTPGGERTACITMDAFRNLLDMQTQQACRTDPTTNMPNPDIPDTAICVTVGNPSCASTCRLPD